MDDKKLEVDPLYKVKTHGRPFEPMDFETYRGQYNDVLLDIKDNEAFRKRNIQYLDEARLATFWYIEGELHGWDTAIKEEENCGDGDINAPDAHFDI